VITARTVIILLAPELWAVATGFTGSDYCAPSAAGFN
jgi:hypothetical protein